MNRVGKWREKLGHIFLSNEFLASAEGTAYPDFPVFLMSAGIRN